MTEVPSFVVLGLVAAVTISLAVLATLSNSLLLFVIYKNPCKCLRRPSTGLIAALSLTDLVTGLVSMPAYSAAVLEGMAEGYINIGLRTVSTSCGIITYTSGVLLVMALSLDRVLACGFVTFYRNYVRFRTSVIVSCLIWLYSVLFSVLQFFGINDEVYHFADISMHHGVPLATIALAYTALCWIIKRHHRTIIPAQLTIVQDSQTTNASTTRQTIQIQRERQMAVVVMITGVLLFLSLVPYLVIIALTIHCSSCNQNVLFSGYMISIFILYLNSIINPFLYAWRLPQYKRSFKAVLPRCILNTTVQSVERRTAMREVAGSSPGDRTLQSGF